MVSIFPFQGLVSQGKLLDDKPCFYVYQVERNDEKYHALIGTVSLDSIKSKVVLPHEETYKDRKLALKQTFLNEPIQHNPILLISDDKVFRERKQELLAGFEPIGERIFHSGFTHRLFRSKASISDLTLPNTLCVADGHHRIGAIMDYHLQNKKCLKSATLMAAILSGANIPSRSKGIVIRPSEGNFENFYTQGRSQQVIQKISAYFDVTELTTPTTPTSALEYCMYIKKKWYQLRLKESLYIEKEHKDLLSIEVFREFVLKKVFYISNYAHHKSVKVIFEDCNISAVRNYIKDQEHFGFVVASDPSDKIMKAARQERILEPNSTYFEPKFIPGMISHKL